MFWSIPQPFNRSDYAEILTQGIEESTKERMREMGRAIALNRIELAKAGQLSI